MKHMQIENNKRGGLLIEVLVSITVIVTALVFLLGMVVFSLRVHKLTEKNNIANSLAQEMIEAVRNFRDSTDWNVNGLGTLTAGALYYPRKSTDTPPKWILDSGQETVNDFVRKVVFSNVNRDAIGNIVEIGGTNDPDTKKVTATVVWEENSIEIVTYFTNWRD